jgi:hypothetical protein
MTTDTDEINLIEELETELITLSDALASACLQPLTGRTAQRVVALAAQISGTVAKVL